MPLAFPNPPAADSLPVPRRKGAFADENCGEGLYEAPRVVRFWHLASLDAPTVAAVWSLAFAWAVRGRLPLWVLALQVLVVWTVYVGDRLLDACAGLRRWGSELRERHFFHWRHRRLLAPMAVAAAGASAAIALHWMPLRIRERDSVLAVASLAYFTRVHAGTMAGGVRRIFSRRIFSKELLVGVLFTVGCALPVWSRAAWLSLLCPVAFFSVLAWLNCHAIERWESGRGGIARLALWTAMGGVAASILTIPSGSRIACLLAAGAACALLLALLDRLRARTTAVTLRAAADLVLLTPALLLAAAVLVRP